MSEENTAGQQVDTPTVQDAGTTTPAQPVSQTPAQTPPASTPQADSEWHTRYNGLQQVHQQTVQELRQAQALLQQHSQHAGTLEQQLVAAQQDRGTLNQNLEQAQSQLTELQQTNQFWNLVSTEFPDLFPVASVLQRVSDQDAQRQILQTARDRLGGAVQQRATQQVAQSFAGVTPGAAPPPSQQQANQYAKDVILQNMERYPVGSPEYNEWKNRWAQHPENSPTVLNKNFVDPFLSDWDRVRQGEEMVVVQDLTTTQGPWAPGGDLNPRS